MFDRPLNAREPRMDWPLWMAVLGLLFIGAAFIHSATGDGESLTLPWWRYRSVAHLTAGAVGMGLVAALCLIDYGRIARWALVGYWVTIPLLLGVFFVPAINGAQRWVKLGPVNFQPSELAKLTCLFALASFLARPTEELRRPMNFAKSLGMALLPCILILKEPDLGSSLVFMPMALAMMFVAGVPGKLLGRFMGTGGLLVGLVLVDALFAPPGWNFIKLQDYQRRRLQVYFNVADALPKNATAEQRREARLRLRDTAVNVDQAVIAIGSGGLTGQGWRQGTQHGLGFLPRLGAHNDFIFSVIAEEEGFLGSVTVIALYTVVLFRGIRIASEARDRLGRLLSVGVVTLLFTHVFVNIGMNIRLMPVTGIPLPLLSAGGTSVLCSLVAIGILQNIQLYRRHY
jgi:rod shape determining protein RodA